jgi:hypothetical protein
MCKKIINLQLIVPNYGQEPNVRSSIRFMGYVSLKLKKRARWDLNPRSPAPKADTLIRARLRALFHTSLMVYGAKGDASVLFRLSIAATPSLAFDTMKLCHCPFLRIQSPSLLPHAAARLFLLQIRYILDSRSIVVPAEHRFEHKQVSYAPVGIILHLGFLWRAFLWLLSSIFRCISRFLVVLGC